MTTDTVSKSGQEIKAIINQHDARRHVELRYGLSVKSIKELDAFYDRNYRILCEDKSANNSHIPSVAKDGYVLKIINSLDSKDTDFIEAQNELLVFLDKNGIVCTTPVKQKDGSYYSTEKLNESGEKHVLRLLTYCEGNILQDVPKTSELLMNIGAFAAKLDNVLKDFSHPAYDTHTSLWIMPAVPKLREYLSALDDEYQINIIGQIISDFEQKVFSIIDTLEKGIIHGDFNENNIVVSSDNKSVQAIIDFGDSYKGCYIFELAICICHMITQENIEMAKYIIKGYQDVRPLTIQEKGILKLCTCARIAHCIVLSNYTYQQEPENDYLIRHNAVKCNLLKKLWLMTDDEVLKIWGIQD